MSAFSFWQKDGFTNRLLLPLSFLYGYAAYRRRQKAVPAKLSVPVIVVGNCVMGGSGKTPITIDLARRLKKAGYCPFILSRGYRGGYKTACRVDLNRHNAKEVGDEALLLAQAAPCYVGAKRYETGKMAIAEGADILLCDDGYQNPLFHQDYRLLVIDTDYGFGNGCIFPAGPLRENKQACLQRADIFLLTGSSPIPPDIPSFNKPIFRLSLAARPPLPLPIPGKWIAFAGIARPEKFFQSLRKNNYRLEKTLSFPDHHRFSDKDAKKLTMLANDHCAKLITTEKDQVKLPDSLKKITTCFKIFVQWNENPEKLISYLTS